MGNKSGIAWPFLFRGLQAHGVRFQENESNEDGLLRSNIFIISPFPFWSLAAAAREKSHLHALKLYASATTAAGPFGFSAILC